MALEALDRCLEDLEERIDPAQEERLARGWKAFLDGELDHGFFVPESRVPAPTAVDWPEVHINDALDDRDMMVLSQMRGVSDVLATGGNAPLTVRCNYGVSIMASQYGCEVVQMDREQGNLPTARSLGSREDIRRAVDMGVPDLQSGDGARVFEAAERFLAVKARYPRVGAWVELYHPDIQGPIDIVELVWGSDMFLAFYDDAPLLRDFLQLVTDHYVAFMQAWCRLVKPGLEYSTHWNTRLKGYPMIRNDSLMNLSPECYTEFIREHDARIIREFGGHGAIHFCGRGDHFIETKSEIEGLTAINLSQPHLNDMETIYTHTVDKGIKLIRLDRSHAENAGRDLKGQVQV